MNASKKPFLKLRDVKFDFPTYDGECSAEKLKNWIRKIEVYFRIQHIKEDESNIQLTSLWLSGTTLIWWERKLQSSKNVGKLFSSWFDFNSALREQFYPLGYKHKALMNWKNYLFPSNINFVSSLFFRRFVWYNV